MSPLRHRNLIGNEIIVKMTRYKLSSCFLFADDAYYILSVEASSFPQKCLYPIIVVFFIVFKMPENSTVWPYRILCSHKCHIFGVPYRPTGKCPRAFFNVLFRIVSDTHREEFEDLSAIILIDFIFMVRLVIQPHNHCRVLRQFDQYFVEFAQSLISEHVDLVIYGSKVIDLRLRGCKNTVPEKGYFLLHG